MASSRFPVLPYVIKGYQIKKMIGQGGVGEIYLAFQPMIERDVAIKVIHKHYANQPTFVKRFDVEARLIARLEHPFIVPMYDYWRSPDGAYLVMRWLKDGSLDKKLKQQGRWEISAVQRMLHQIGSALTLAHSQGIVHRDIKPDNILLDENMNTFLTDFGIALNIKEPLSENDQEFISYGSPIYTAPEQYTKNYLSVQGDIYSLAVVVYEILTGSPPFWGDSITQVLNKQFYEPFPSLIPTLTWFSPHLILPLDRVLIKATNKDPFSRYASVADFIEAFDDAVSNLNVSGGVASTTIADGSGHNVASHSASMSDTINLTGNMDERFGTIQLANHVAWQPLNPYKGLAAFDEADTAHFFGREQQVINLIESLNRMIDDDLPGLVCVVGASGSGKSSLVRAGLVPVVREGQLAGNWYVTLMTPGATPMQNLLEALNTIAMQPFPGLENHLQSNMDGLSEVIKTILTEDANLLLVVDQFEEIFTQTTNETERSHFLNLLATTAKQQGANIYIICTLRADYYEHALSYGDFAELLQVGTELVLPLTEADLIRVIEEPAMAVGLSIEPQLSQLIAYEFRQSSASLPLLQFTLSALYEQCQDHILDHATYQNIGGVRGALAQHADSIIQSLSESEQALARKLFFRLVVLPRSGKPVRQRISRLDLLAAFDAERASTERLLDLFYRGRLFVYDRDPQSRLPTVEIAHEALLTSWDQLEKWIDEARSLLRTHQRLQMAVQEWTDATHNESFLAAGTRLTELETLRETAYVTLTPVETRYLDASLQQRKLAQRQRQIVIITLTTAAILAMILASIALFQRQIAVDAVIRADTAAAVAQSRELAALAQANLSSQPRVALESSLQAFNFSDTYEARNLLLTTIQQHPFLASYTQVGSPVVAIDYHQDMLAAGLGDGQVRITQPDSAMIIWQAHDERIHDIVLRDNLLITASEDATVRVWDIETHNMSGQPLTLDGSVWSIDVNPAGTMAVAGDASGMITIWEIESGNILQQWAGHVGSVFYVGFSPEDDKIISAGEDQILQLWEVGLAESVQSFGDHGNWILTADFSPNGQVVISAGVEGIVRFWDVASGERLLEMPTDHTNWIRDLEFDRTGRFLYTASQDGSVRVWDTTTLTLALPPLAAHTDTVWQMTLDANTLYTASEDGQILMWDMTTASRLMVSNDIYDGEVLVSSFSDDGKGLVLLRQVDNQVYLDQIDVDSGSSVKSWDITGITLTHMALSDDKQFVAGYNINGQLYVWDVKQNTVIYQAFLGQTDALHPFVFLPGQNSLLISAQNGLSLLDMETGDRVFWNDTLPSAYTIAISPDAAHVALGMRDGQVLLWNKPENHSISFEGHVKEVTSLHFLDNQTLISGSRDRLLHIWNLDSGDALPLSGHQDWVFASAVSKNLDMIASGGRDDRLIIWDTESAQSLGLPQLFPDWVINVHYNSDGDLLTVTRDGQVTRWAGTVEKWKHIAQGMLR